MVTKFKILIFITFLLLQVRNIVYAQYWELIPESPTNVSSMACDAYGNLWAGTDDGYIYLYNGTWEKKDSISQRITSIAVAPNGYIYFSAGSLLYWSINGGNIWNRFYNDNDNFVIYKIIPDNISVAVYFATDRFGVYYINRSDDIIRTSVDNELSNRRVNSLALAPNGTLYAGTHGTGIYSSTDGGVSWLPSISYANAEINCLAIVDNNIIFAAASENGILKSTDAGQSWARCDPTISGRPTYAHNIIYNSTTGELFAHIEQYSLYGGSILISTDLGQSWVLQEHGLPTIGTSYNTNIFTFNHITSETYLAVSRAENSNGVYRFLPDAEPLSDTNNVRVVIGEDYSVKPNGTVRISVDAIDDLTGKNVKDFWFTLRYNKRILYLNDVSLWGNTITSNLDVSIEDPTHGEIVIRVTNGIGEPLTGTGRLINLYFFALGGDSCGTHLILESFIFNEDGPKATTHDGYCELFGRCGGEAIYVISEQNALLSQNNPNPVREGCESTIQYRINVAGETSLIVYDVLGREVTKLVNEYKSEGIYSVNFNTRSLPSGVYLYKLRAPGYQAQKKMVIVR